MEPGAQRPRRTYDWIGTVPEGLTVVAGHHVRSKQAPLIVTNDSGGRVIFLGTGCGKDGPLSGSDTEPGGRERIGTRTPAGG